MSGGNTITGSPGAHVHEDSTGEGLKKVAESNELWGYALKAAMVFQAVTAAKAAKDIAKLQNDLAKRYLKIAEELHDQWKSLYKPHEIRLLQEAFSRSDYNPDYIKIRDRMHVDIMVKTQMENNELLRKGNKYCLGLTAESYKTKLIEDQKLLADATNKAYRLEEEMALKKNEYIYNCKKMVLDLGRNLVGNALDSMGGYQNQLNSMQKNANDNSSSAFAFLTKSWVSEGTTNQINSGLETSRGGYSDFLNGVSNSGMTGFDPKSGGIGFNSNGLLNDFFAGVKRGI